MLHTDLDIRYRDANTLRILIENLHPEIFLLQCAGGSEKDAMRDLVIETLDNRIDWRIFAKLLVESNKVRSIRNLYSELSVE